MSILIPAFRPDWLDLAISSALAQTHRDFELLVSDDSAEDEVRSVVSRWRDPRLRYLRNPNRGRPAANGDYLIRQSRGRYLKFLFDDDFLLPNAVEILFHACERLGADLAFHNRYVVDEGGRLLDRPQAVRGFGYAEITPRRFFPTIVGRGRNDIGEPSNMMIRRATLKSLPDPFSINGRRMRFLNDVAVCANVLASGHRVIGSAEFASAFRVHDKQNSNQSSRIHSAGIYEWDLLRRWSAWHGHITTAEFASGHQRQLQMYARWLPQYPELQAFVELGASASDGNYLDARFIAALRRADDAMDARTVEREH